MNLEIKTKSIEAEQFSLGHPALSLAMDANRSAIDIVRYVVCKNGICDYPGPKTKNIYRDDEDYAKWRSSEYFDEEDIIPGIDEDPPIEVPYDVYYGYEWEPAAVEYWADISWLLYMGEKYSVIPDWKEIAGFHGADLGPFDTYEETWIAVAEWIRENLGDYKYGDLMTEEEKANNRETSPFTFIDSSKKGFKELKSNKKWIHITDEILNNRWFIEFTKSDYFKNNWKSTFESNNYGLPYKDVYDRLTGIDDLNLMRLSDDSMDD